MSTREEELATYNAGVLRAREAYRSEPSSAMREDLEDARAAMVSGDCYLGWIGVDENDQPIPCPECRPQEAGTQKSEEDAGDPPASSPLVSPRPTRPEKSGPREDAGQQAGRTSLSAVPGRLSGHRHARGGA